MNTHSNHYDTPVAGPSEAHDHVEPPYQLSHDVTVPPPRRSNLKLVMMCCGAVLLTLGVGLGVLFWMLINHSVSNEQIRAQIESQLTSFLGADHSASIGDTKIALGEGGLLSIDASDVKILRDDTLSLGVAREVGVKVKSLPLITGNVVAESVTMRGASIAVDSILPDVVENELRPAWPRSVNLAAALQSIGQLANRIAGQVDSAGLESLALEDTNLVGFDQFGLRSRTARLESLMIEAVEGANSKDDLTFNALVKTEFSDWELQGLLVRTASGGSQMQFSAKGLSIGDLVGPTVGDEVATPLTHNVSLSFSAPFFSDGTPDIASARISIGPGAIPVGKKMQAQLEQAEFNLRLQPKDNLLSIDRSMLQFDRSRAILHGAVRYPTGDGDAIAAQPLFRLTVDEFQAFGLVKGDNPPMGTLRVDGFLDPLRQAIEADRIELTTPSGSITGEASVRLDGQKPHLKMELALGSMPVEEFKLFWPPVLAPKARKWMDENLTGGQIDNAWVKADFPPDVIGQDVYYQAENLTARIPISGARVKNPGELPPIEKAIGAVDVIGNHTNITVDRGTTNVPGGGGLQLAKSTLKMGNYAIPDTPVTMDLNFSGPASAMVKLASLKPLGFSNRLKIQPGDLKGNATAEVDAYFNLNKKLTLAKKPWRTRLTTKNLSSTKPINGRKMEKANFTIVASPREAKIDGAAIMDGVPVKVALVEPLDGSGASLGQVSLTLTDLDRWKMGLNTGDIIAGPIQTVVTSLKDGSQRVEADLKQARLNFPWVGWSKGKGIDATASFSLRQKDGVMSFSDLKLRGQGFSANASFVVDKAGLRSANVTNVKLNRVDDFDIEAQRGDNSYRIKLDARTYDGRALIRSLLNAKLKPGEDQTTSVSVTGQVGRLIGFGEQELRNVNLEFLQQGNSVSRVLVDAIAAGNAPTRFELGPVPGGTKTDISTTNAGALLRFLDLYTKLRGGSMRANLVRDDSQVFRGRIVANNFTLLNEPRLAQLLQKPSAAPNLADGDEIIRSIRTIKTDRAQVERLQAQIEKGPGIFKISKGRLSGGDASAAFDGTVYDQNNRMRISGTFLPARGLNQMVSKIPLIGLAFGQGKVNGLLGITFRLSGRFDNPALTVNPLSIIAPGVFRQLFKF
ncbi:MAG: DUF3971 domain-containing protein [Rhizobiaceae bacterium]